MEKQSDERVVKSKIKKPNKKKNKADNFEKQVCSVIILSTLGTLNHMPEKHISIFFFRKKILIILPNTM